MYLISHVSLSYILECTPFFDGVCDAHSLNSFLSQVINIIEWKSLDMFNIPQKYTKQKVTYSINCNLLFLTFCFLSIFFFFHSIIIYGNKWFYWFIGLYFNLKITTVTQKCSRIYVDFDRISLQYDKLFIFFFIGNDNLHAILSEKRIFKLRFLLVDVSGERAYAEYSNFYVGNVDSNYELSISGYSGTAGKICSGFSDTVVTIWSGFSGTVGKRWSGFPALQVRFFRTFPKR